MMDTIQGPRANIDPLRDMGLLSEQLFALGPLLLALVDPALNYVRISRKLAEILGRKPSYFPGKAVYRHGFNAEHRVAMQQVLETDQIQVLKNWTVTTSTTAMKSPGFWQWTIVPLHDRHQRVYGLLLSGCDVTERRLLESEVITAAAQERQEVGRDIHDHVGQLLVGLSMKTKALECMLADEGNAGVSAARELRELTTEVLTAFRRIARRLYPVDAEQGDFVNGLRRLIDDTIEWYDVSCRITAPDHEPEMEPVQGIHIHAIVKQAIRHAVRQARAREMTVDFIEEPDYYTVKVTHNGKAFKYLRTIQGYRLMTFHAHTIGGRMSVQGSSGDAVTFTGRFPRRIENDA